MRLAFSSILWAADTIIWTPQSLLLSSLASSCCCCASAFRRDPTGTVDFCVSGLGAYLQLLMQSMISLVVSLRAHPSSSVTHEAAAPPSADPGARPPLSLRPLTPAPALSAPSPCIAVCQPSGGAPLHPYQRLGILENHEGRKNASEPPQEESQRCVGPQLWLRCILTCLLQSVPLSLCQSSQS